jgi:hypothetical protein
MTISINKGINDHRQKTGNKSGEQTSPFLFPSQTFGSAKVAVCFFHEEKEQTYVWNPLLLLRMMNDYG